MRPYVDKTVEGSGAEKAGIQSGDLIVAVNGEKVTYYSEFIEKMQSFGANENIAISVERAGDSKTFDLQLSDDKKAGIYPSVTDLSVTDTYGFLASIPAGFNRTIKVLTDQVRQFKIIFNRTTEGYKKMQGPIGIVTMMSPTWDWDFFWGFLAYFSIWLAFLNLLPIPALDGGHVMFLLYEMITGRPPSEKVLETGQIIGFVFLMGLMAIIFGNDIWNLIKDKF
jgi:regulator of sigma E protease